MYTATRPPVILLRLSGFLPFIALHILALTFKYRLFNPLNDNVSSYNMNGIRRFVLCLYEE